LLPSACSLNSKVIYRLILFKLHSDHKGAAETAIPFYRWDSLVYKDKWLVRDQSRHIAKSEF
jgi:hypothetical protein